ncbi:MAG: hypothetical protein ACOYOB_10435, partial [Myxococcota bacterium]
MWALAASVWLVAGCGASGTDTADVTEQDAASELADVNPDVADIAPDVAADTAGTDLDAALDAEVPPDVAPPVCQIDA